MRNAIVKPARESSMHARILHHSHRVLCPTVTEHGAQAVASLCRCCQQRCTAATLGAARRRSKRAHRSRRPMHPSSCVCSHRPPQVSGRGRGTPQPQAPAAQPREHGLAPAPPAHCAAHSVTNACVDEALARPEARLFFLTCAILVCRPARGIDGAIAIASGAPDCRCVPFVPNRVAQALHGRT